MTGSFRHLLSEEDAALHSFLRDVLDHHMPKLLDKQGRAILLVRVRSRTVQEARRSEARRYSAGVDPHCSQRDSRILHDR
jgi:hypothetical protein